VSGRVAGLLRRLRRQPEPFQLSDADLQGLDPVDRRIVERVWPHTMTSVARIGALINAVRYCIRRKVPGDFAECGVWLGGSVMAMILTLQEMGVNDRDVFLYDTFEGMTRPTERDTSPFERPALEGWDEEAGRVTSAWWASFFEPETLNEEAVRERVLSSGYPEARLHFVRGAVEETLPQHAPDRLALLRLDTDWYESTRHELVNLYPRLSHGGVLLIDDYGHWEGCRRAVDEYFASHAPPVLLNRVDYTARIAVKH
jgi:O-methyltransferase